METIKIRRQGYSHRIPFVDFVQRYAFLAFSCDEQVVANKESAKTLLLRLNLDGWAIGKSKVFLKYYHIDFLAKTYEDQLRKIIIVQSLVRRWLARKRVNQLKKMINSGLVMQKYTRGWLARKRVSDMKNTLTKCKNANRQHSPDFDDGKCNGNINLMNASTASSSAANAAGNISYDGRQLSPPACKDKSNRHNLPDIRYQREREFTTSFESPEKAALLIQKCVRGYLTRKMVKSSQRNSTPDNGQVNQGKSINQVNLLHQQHHHHHPHHQHQQQQVHHHQQQPSNALAHAGHFVSRRMQSYQPQVVTVLSANSNHNGNVNNGTAASSAAASRIPTSLVSSANTNYNAAAAAAAASASASASVSGVVNAPHNRGKHSHGNSSSNATAFNILKSRELTSINVTSSFEHTEKENQMRKESLWWRQPAPSSVTASPGRNDPRVSPNNNNNNNFVNNNDNIKLLGNSKALVEVASWSQRAPHANPGNSPRASGSVVTVTVKDHLQSNIITHGKPQQQGPYEFRKILKPPLRNSTRAASSDDLLAITSNRSICNSATGSSWGSASADSGPFDFRKLLRRTNHAPTDTLKRCKGMLAPASNEASSV